MVINTSLATFMKIAITAVVVSAFIFGTMYVCMGGIADNLADYVNDSG
ncbi:hypothetical protein [Mesobacillus zeae]